MQAAGTKVGTDYSDWYFDFHIGGDSLAVDGDWLTLNRACTPVEMTAWSSLRTLDAGSGSKIPAICHDTGKLAWCLYPRILVLGMGRFQVVVSAGRGSGTCVGVVSTRVGSMWCGVYYELEGVCKTIYYDCF